MSKLVIVESPHKATMIKKYLNPNKGIFLPLNIPEKIFKYNEIAKNNRRHILLNAGDSSILL